MVRKSNDSMMLRYDVDQENSDKFLEIIRGNTHKLPSGIEYNLFDPIGEMTIDQIKELRIDILKIIEKEPDNVITGTYTYGNLTYKRRERNLIVKINHDENQLIVNCNPNWAQIVIFGNNLTKLLTSSIKTLVEGIPKFFIFASGPDLIEFIDKNISFEERLSNIVYELEKDDVYTGDVTDKYEVSIYPVDTVLNEEENKLFNDIWGYDAISSALDRPHVLVTTKKNGERQGVGGARANEVIDGLSVIGGVNTKKKYRRQGIGFLASYKMAIYLLDTGNRVFLETDEGNFPARKIYEKIGFREVGVSSFFDYKTGVIPDIMGDRDY